MDSPFLFKYCDPHGVDIIRSPRLKITPPIEFNDPFEFMPKVEMWLSRAWVAKQLSSAKRLRLIWRSIRPDLNFEAFRQIYLKELHRRGARHIRSTLDEMQTVAIRAKEGILGFMSRRFGVACYSEIAADILMWAHYTSLNFHASGSS